jgi:SAM-dependent methyltransferase
MNDLFNLTLAQSDTGVDQINRKFYGRYNYPWQASVFPVYPAGVGTRFLNQDLGYWDHQRIEANARIWVAGCGTNQALFTALKFPQAEVLGTDISTVSLQVCKKNAEQMGIRNLRLEEKSLNEVDYIHEFDYIICTGVIHHNAEPAGTLNRIGMALKKNGVLELMVYNYYHRLLTTSCQKAIRTFYDSQESFNMELELSLLLGLLNDYGQENEMGQFLKSFKNIPEAAIADSLLQPVEYSYTIESLGKMAGACNLDYLAYCPNQFDVNKGLVNWNMDLGNEQLQERYDQLPDERRWQITNLLLYKDSPMLWFYFQRKDALYTRKTEREINEGFLATTFGKANFPMGRYILNGEGKYGLSDKGLSVAARVAKDGILAAVLERVDGQTSMQGIVDELGIQAKGQFVQELRTKLTTSAFPLIIAHEHGMH